jgi:hypothetical protein
VLLLAAFPVLLDQLGEIDRLLSHAPHLVGWIAGSRRRIEVPSFPNRRFRPGLDPIVARTAYPARPAAR